MIVFGKQFVGVVATALVIGWSALASAGIITITERESRGNLSLFAGSGGAVDQYANEDVKADLTGAFGFGDSWDVAIDESQPYSLGTAGAIGSISVSDNVTQVSPGTLVLTATRSASGAASVISGASNASSTQGQTFRVRFTTGADPVNYTLTGDFDPGAITGVIGDARTISLRRPFTANHPVLIETAMSGIYETGTLPANQTWEFFVKMTDMTIANAGSPYAADSSSLDITLTLTSVPEPASVCLLAGSSWVLLTRKPRRPVK